MGSVSLRRRLLDVGCGPGTITRRLAPLFEAVVGLDPDPGMLAEAARLGIAAGIPQATWVQERAEALPMGLGLFLVITFGASFGEDDIFRAAGFLPARTVVVPDGREIDLSIDKIVAGRFSLSGTAPHLFGDRIGQFESDLRALLADASSSGRFSVRLPDNILRIWQPA